jgi:polysaccharide chain length determinant protein (PEP-CTERM system associated)
MTSQKGGLDAVQEIWGRRKGLAILTFAVAVTGTVAFVGALPNIYRASARLLVDPRQVQAPQPTELETRLQMISQEFLSRGRLAELVTRFDLYPVMRKRGVSMQRVVERMSNDITTEFSGVENAQAGGNVPVAVMVEYRGRDPEKVTQVANTLASFYLEEDVNIDQRQAKGTMQSLKTQLDDVKKKLDEQSRRVGDYQDQHMGELPQQGEANLANLERLSSQLRMTMDDRSKAVERREDLVRKLAETAPAEAGGSPDVFAERLSKLQQQLTELRRTYSDKYPDVIRLKAEIATLERQAQEAKPQPAADPNAGASRSVVRLREQVADLDAQIKSLRADEDRVRREMASYHSRIENAPRRARNYEEINREYETTRDLYNSLLKRYEEARLSGAAAQSGAGPQFRVLDYASVPKEPSAPNRLRLLFVGLALAVGAALGAVALAEQLDTSFHTVDDVRAFTRVPVLVSIPAIVTTGDRRRRQFRWTLGACALAAGMVVMVQAAERLAHNELLLSILGKG